MTPWSRVVQTLLLFIGTLLLAVGCDRMSAPLQPDPVPAGANGTRWVTGSSGCTPGYWKQPQHFDSWPTVAPANYLPTDSFNAVFEIGTNWFPNSFTLLDALNAKGGGVNALARHATAALLNAAKEFYPISWEFVRTPLMWSYFGVPGYEVETIKNLFEGHNELGCPLN